MQVISFKNTSLFKRGIWLSAAALIAFAITPSALDGSLLQHPAAGLMPAGILSACFGLFLWKTQFHRLVDEVVDCEDHLQVQRGGTQEIVSFTNISDAEVSSAGGLHRITVRLREPTKLGGRFAFLPQASLWSNPARVQRVAIDLKDRAKQANSGQTR
ncbi:MAG: hypothetical protein ABJD53_11770 [Gammaproteobacteria bacterium]